MDRTPTRKDSGFIDSSSVKRHLLFSSYESTPSSTKPISRKRKTLKYKIPATVTSVPVNNVFSKQNYTEYKPTTSIHNSTANFMNESAFSENSFLNNSKIFNSTGNCSFHESSFDKGCFQKSSPINITTNEDYKLSSSLKKCSIDDLELKYESHNDAKKRKWENEELECSKKSNSAPGTPQRPETESDSYLKKFHSLEFTPKKIGTPERNEILYPRLIEVKPATKPKSPLKLRNELKRLSKPARKRLFPCKDFIHLFTNVKKISHVLHEIFSYLEDSDLVNVAKVSKLWKKALENDRDAYKRYRLHVKNVTISKENIYFNTSTKLETYPVSFPISNKCNLQLSELRSSPISPARENWNKFAKMGAQLKPAQRLTKCLICFHPAVIENSIAQCSKSNCSYLWCIKCMSGSKTGTADFYCTCSGSLSPPSPFSDRSGLSDISNIDGSASYYFTEELINNNNSSTNISSGYFSQSDAEKSSMYQSFEQKSKAKHSILTDCNKNVTIEKSYSNNTSILEHRAARHKAKLNLSKRKDITEPTSPQKTRIHALGTKQSKRNLRRLIL